MLVRYMARVYLRTLSFWLSFAFGWFVVACILSVFVGFAGSHAFDGLQAVAIGVAVHLLSAAAGFSYARSRVRRVEPRGFPVVPKSDDDSRAA